MATPKQSGFKMSKWRQGPPRLAARRGISLIEMMVGMTMFTLALLGLAGAASVGLKNSTRSRLDSQYWADAQRVIDSLIMRGFNASTSSSTSVNGRPIKWVIGSGASAPQDVKVIIWRTGYQNRFATVVDTIQLYLSKTAPGT
jgi:Tfp pilus assembly protein PilV